MRPLQSNPQVLLNDQPPRGDLDPLELELGQVDAAYRMSFTCSQIETLRLRWVRGLAGQNGHVHYRVGFAIFRDGTLVESGAEEAVEETFWY